MTKKIIVAKTGYNALTEADVDNIVFHSDYNTLKYYVQGTITVTTDQADYYDSDAGSPPVIPATYYHYTVDTVDHSLGYVPYFCGYFHLSETTACQAPWAFGDAGFWAYQSVFADSTYLYFVVHFNSISNSGNVESDFSYRIFKNSLGL